MYRPNDLQNITYVWSNAEGLVGDDITFLVCRALIKLPPNQQDVDKVVGVYGKNVIDGISWADNTKGVMGKLLVDLNLQLLNREKETEFVKLALPYRAVVKSSRLGEINPEVKYVYAKKVGMDSLLVEGIISLTSLGYLPWRGDTGITGEFSSSSTIKIALGLPEVQEMVSAQVRFMPLSYCLEEDALTLNGWQETHLMYITGKNRGEEVIVTRQIEPFTETIILNEKLSSLGFLEITNGNIQSQVISGRKVLVVGNFKLTAQSATPMGEAFSSNNVLEKMREMTQKIQAKKKVKEVRIATPDMEEEKIISEVKSEPEINTFSEIMPKETLQDLPEVLTEEISISPELIDEKLNSTLAETKSEKIPLPEEKEMSLTAQNIIIPRESKRARLNRHMRSLKK